MIARIWRGKTRTDHYEEYTSFMNSVAIPDYKSTEGFIKLIFLRRIEEDAAHFTLITFWKDLDVIKNFAGVEYDTAKYYPKDTDYLLEFEEKVRHFEVFAET